MTGHCKKFHVLSTALSQLVNIAYSMNINGFNASVETAREGNSAECLAATEKRIDDIIFQSRILSSQFALESERINRETFRVLTQVAITADTNLVKTRNVAEYREAIAKFLQELNKEVSALEIGGSFVYFAKEYEYFLKCI